MKRVLVAACLALCLSACGSTEHTVQVRKSPAAYKTPVRFALSSKVNLVILPPIRGTGNERLGTFTPHGTVDLELSCKGPARSITLVGISRTSPCDGSPVGIGVPGEEGKRMDLVVRVAPGTTWRLAVGEEIPGANLLLVHRKGSGSASLGTFRLRRPAEVSLSCTGKGNLTLDIASQPPTSGVGTFCPQSGLGTTISAADGRRAHFSITAGPKVRWSIAISETPAGTATAARR
jgi:hypothetical protein